MNRYKIVKQLGDGTYGSVLLATSVESGEKVAIKIMKKKFFSWEECLNLREVKSLRKLKHPNIVRLKEVIRENDQLNFVFEHMKENLYEMMKKREKMFPESAIRNITYQIFQGLAFMHKHGFFHRDVKPENLLCNGPECIKIADFGLAREIRSRPPYTDYVSTRWYRAPEVLLRSTNYSSPIDIWAVGCIIAELYSLRPLFPGSSEIDQIFKICSTLGTPEKEDWPEGFQLAVSMNFRWPQCTAARLKSIIPNASNDGLQLIMTTLAWDPKKRPSCTQALRYPYFQTGGQQLGLKAGFPQTAPKGPSALAPVPPVFVPQPSTVPPKRDDIMPRKDSLPRIQPRRESHLKIEPVLQRRFSIKDPLNMSAKGRDQPRKLSTQYSDLDDWDDLDFSVQTTKKPSPVHSKTKPPFGTGSDSDAWIQSITKTKNRDNRGSAISSMPSAKQHYVSNSRYLPGSNRKGSGKLGDGLWSGINLKSSNPTQLDSERGDTIPLGRKSSYVPSFGGPQENRRSSIAHAMTWKKFPSPINDTRLSPCSGVGRSNLSNVPKRTDWAAKYLH